MAGWKPVTRTAPNFGWACLEQRGPRPSLLPTRMFRQAGVEFLDQPGFVIAGVSPVEEPIEPLAEQPFPRTLLAARIDRKKQRAILLCGAEVAGRVTDHQDFHRRIFVLGRKLEMLGFCSHLLAGDHRYKRIDAVLSPFALERVGRRL